MRYVLLLCLLLTVSMAAFAQGGLALPAEVYATPGPHVVVNGTLLQAPVQKVNGSLLLPMRAVFEALDAQVRWYPAAQQIIATRGATTVQLWINRPVAIVNDQEIVLAAPPTLMGGSTYVPLRFPAEAFGGEVKWFGAIQTAAITIAPLQTAAPPTPQPQPIPQPLPQPQPDTPPATLDGVLLTKVTAGVMALLVQNAKGETALVQMAPAAVITRANATQAPQAATFAALEPGDQLLITRDAAGKATAVAARFTRINGVAAAIANNKLLLQDGSLYQLQADIRVVNTAGQAVPLSQVSNGTAVTLDLTPDTTNVWRVTVPLQAAPPPPAPAVRAPGILTVAAVGYTKALKAGDTLTIQVTGEPGADRVLASVGDIIRNLALDEMAPGTYTRKVTIAANTNVTQAAITAVMRLNGQDSESVKSAHPITIDTRPPSFNALIPGDGTQLLDRNPTLEAAYADPGGSGVDAKSVKVLVNGTDVTKVATITDARLSYKAQELPLGPVTVHIELADLAGNTASAEWKMTVAEARAAAAQYLKHDVAAPLMAGQTIKLAGKFATVPLKLEWFLGNKLISTSLTKDALSGEYRVAYTIDPADALGEHSVSVRLYTAAEQSQVLFAVTPVTVVAQPKALKIIAPVDKTKSPVPLIVTGQATPGVQVRVTITYTSLVAILQVQGELYKAVLTADVQGAWKTDPIDTDTMLVKPDTYLVIAERLDADGKVTETAKITLTRR